MTKIYACLVGNWVCLNDDPDCVIGTNGQSPYLWYEEGGDIWAPMQREEDNTYYQLNYVKLHFQGKDYRINPIYIQIVEE